MPTYEYECTRCGQLTSEFRPITAPRRQRCPHCRGRVQPIITGGMGVLFKGDGFYINDSRKAARGSADKAPADASGSASGSSGSGTAPAGSGAAAAGPGANTAGGSGAAKPAGGAKD